MSIASTEAALKKFAADLRNGSWSDDLKELGERLLADLGGADDAEDTPEPEAPPAPPAE